MDFRGSFDGFSLAVFEVQRILNTAGKAPNDSITEQPHRAVRR